MRVRRYWLHNNIAAFKYPCKSLLRGEVRNYNKLYLENVKLLLHTYLYTAFSFTGGDINEYCP